MRAMIVAAGRGTRMQPLSDWVPKPAVPVRGLPLIAYPLALLAQHGVSEVMLNTHHLAERLEAEAREHCPAGLELHFSREETLLDTGGGIRRVANFLRESDPCLILGGDMLLDADLGDLLRRHRADPDRAISFLLREDPRAEQFGSVGVDADGIVCRIGSRFHAGGPTRPERRAGVYVWANVASASAFDSLPDREIFSHFEGWLAPRLAAGARDLIGEFLPSRWEPVGTLAEYLAANLHPLEPSYLDVEARARARGVRFEGDCVLGAGAHIGAGASLARVVVWDGERVPEDFQGTDGVFARGRFVRVPA